LRNTTHSSSWTNSVVRLSIGCVAFVSATATAQAQTYYYYPSSGTAAPGVTTGTTTAPTYYYRKGWFGRRIVWSGYSPQAYQTANSPQVYEAANNQPKAAEAPTSVPVVPTSYTTNETQPAAGAATAAPGATAAIAATTVAAPASLEAGDPYGFTGWLNATRASYGLSAVGHDPNLSNWAAENNNHQAARGMGHFVMGPARRQNAAFGSVSNIGAMWMNSPAHRAALLDPTIRWIGIAGLGAYWTFNAY
jgi:uncharacterized protein YkwD